MPHLVAVSDVVLVGLVGFAGVVVTAVGGIVVAALGRDVKQRGRTVAKTVDEFETSWRRRGELLDGLGADLDRAHARIDASERREAECQQKLAAMATRVAELEARGERRRRAQ